LKIKMY